MNVEFSEESQGTVAARRPASAKPSWMSSLVIKMGLAKDEKGVAFVLILVAIIAAALAAGIYVTSEPKPLPLERATPEPLFEPRR